MISLPQPHTDATPPRKAAELPLAEAHRRFLAPGHAERVEATCQRLAGDWLRHYSRERDPEVVAARQRLVEALAAGELHAAGIRPRVQGSGFPMGNWRRGEGWR